MPVTKTITLYTFDELPSEKAKERARDWYRKASEGDDWWDFIYEDGEHAGIKITGFDCGRGSSIEAKALKPMAEIARLIVEEHGEVCATHETAKAFLAKGEPHAALEPDSDDGIAWDKWNDEKTELEEEFWHAILQDYLSMLRRELDWTYADEQVDENILANGYTFREDGKRED